MRVKKAPAQEQVETCLPQKKQSIFSQLLNKNSHSPITGKCGNIWISLETVSHNVSTLRLHVAAPPSTWYFQVTVKTSGFFKKSAFMSASLTSPTLCDVRAIKEFLASLGYRSATYQRLTDDGFRDVIFYA